MALRARAMCHFAEDDSGGYAGPGEAGARCPAAPQPAGGGGPAVRGLGGQGRALWPVAYTCHPDPPVSPQGDVAPLAWDGVGQNV